MAPFLILARDACAMVIKFGMCIDLDVNCSKNAWDWVNLHNQEEFLIGCLSIMQIYAKYISLRINNFFKL